MNECYPKNHLRGGNILFMNRFVILLYTLSVQLKPCSSSTQEFPASFKFGAATSSYQVEGAWNISDKGESIWDHYTHSIPSPIADGSNGDMACDSYHLWKRDIEMAAELGLHFYRFSISWPRLLPDGYTNRISEDGKKYYNNLIDGLLDRGIEPVVTLYHWELPQSMQEIGGWTNPLISEWFSDYSRVVFSLYADRVKTWITINEPISICDYFYTSAGPIAPGITSVKLAPYICNKNILIAHAKAWRIYDEEFKPKYLGKVSVSNNVVWYQPLSSKDKRVAELVIQHYVGRYTHPIYSKEGGWPPAIEKIMREVSIKEGYSGSRMPKFTEAEIKLIQGTFDYFALNYYTSRLVRSARPGEDVVAKPDKGVPELNAVIEADPSWPDRFYFLVYPEGLRKQLVWIKENYGDVEIQITENGDFMNIPTVLDESRIDFIRRHLEQVLLSSVKYGVNVTAYTYWSLMDNFEWILGYTLKFGLYEVDFSSPQRTRTPRASARFYKNLIRTRKMTLNFH